MHSSEKKQKTITKAENIYFRSRITEVVSFPKVVCSLETRNMGAHEEPST